MQVWVGIAIGVGILIIAGLAWWIYERNRTKHLQDRFGPEYDRRVAAVGSRRRAEADLAREERKIQRLKLRPLSASARARFTEEWRLCQARFVDDPAGALEDADALLTDMMRMRGYTIHDDYERSTSISAAYPRHAEAYRDASKAVVRHRRGDASTEDLRAALVSYRSLFDEILGGRDEEHKRAA